MADYTISAKITGDASGYESAVNKANKASSKLSKTVSNVLDVLKEFGKGGLVESLGQIALGFGSITTVVSVCTKTLSGCVKAINETSEAYKDSLKVERQLEQAAKNNPYINEDSIARLKDYASEIQSVSNFDGDELIGKMSQLVALGRSEAEVMKIIKVATDMASDGTISIDTAITQLNATLNGNIGRLGQQNKELKTLTQEELESGKAIDILGEKFKGMAEATADTSIQLKNLKGDFKEAIGRFTLPTSDLWNKFWSGFYKDGTNVINKLSDDIEKRAVNKALAQYGEQNYQTILKGIDRRQSTRTSALGIKNYARSMTSPMLDVTVAYLEKEYPQLIEDSQTEEGIIYNILKAEQQRKEEIKKEREEEEARLQKLAEEEAERKRLNEEQTKFVIDLKQQHAYAIKQKEEEWKYTEEITGKEIDLNEKLSFYQKDLIEILSEGSGLITKNNEYYKRQIAIINDIKEKLAETGEVVEENGVVVETNVVTVWDTVREKIKGVVNYLRENWGTILKSIVTSTMQFGAKLVTKVTEVIGNIINVISNVSNYIVNIFNSIKYVLSKLFEFDVDEALDNLLKVEDSILTFFVETLPRLPSFFESAFSSVLTLIGSITNSINWENVKKIISSIIETVVTYAPKIIKGIIDLFVNLGNTLQQVLAENAPSIVDALGTMFFTIIESLPGLITNVITVAGTYISQIGKYITDNAEKLSTDLTSIVKSIVDSISTFITNGGWKNILSAILTIQKSIENAVADNMPAIAEAITKALPDLVQMLIDSIVSASRTLGKIAKTLLPLIAKIINALVEVITSDEVVESSIEAIEGIIEGLIPAIVDIMVNALPKLITFFLLKLPSYIPKLIGGIVSALINGFNKVNWGQVVQDVFTGFVDAFKNMFGIHSPSTLFESFGGYIVQGFVNGLKGIAEATMIILQPIINLLQSTFSGLGELIMNSMNASLQNVINILNTLGSITINLTNSIFGGLKVMVDSSTESMKVLGKVTIATMGAIVKTMADVHNILRDIIKSVTTIKVRTPWQTYEIGGVDIGTVSAPDISGYINLINAFAKGTDNAPKGLAIVGEAGPELVNFNGGEQVLNNRNTNKALEGMGTKTNNFNVTFNNLQDTSAYAMMNQLKQYNRQMAINGIL